MPVLRLVVLALLVVPSSAAAQSPTTVSGLDLGSGRVVSLSGTDLGSGRVVDRFRVSEAQMERLLADERFSVAVRRAGEIHVEAASGFVLHAARAREGVANCTRWATTCVIRSEREPDRVLIISPLSARGG
ncbi:MAG: hypothetical protein AAF845_06295 [Bacteroidota bacterium]